MNKRKLSTISADQTHGSMLVVWLDKKSAENTGDYRSNLTELRRAGNVVHAFTDADRCVEFIREIEHDKVCVITSDEIDERVHDLIQVDTMIIFNGEKEFETKNWPKVKGIYFDILSICDILKEIARQCEQNSISANFLHETGSSFVVASVLQEIFSMITYDEHDFEKFIEYCQTVFIDNAEQIKNVDKFRREHNQRSPVWWFTYDCFLYPMLNRALRLLDLDIIVNMSFFIFHLQQQMDKLHKEQLDGAKVQFNQEFNVYRGQGMAKAEFEKLQRNKNHSLFFNNFLCTSKKRDLAMRFARNGAENPDNVGVLFTMTVGFVQSTVPFASIRDISYRGTCEDEVLFSMKSVFKIKEIKQIGRSPIIFEVKLLFMNNIRKLNGVDSQKLPIYQQFATSFAQKEKYKDAIYLYQKIVNIQKQLHPSHDLDLANTYKTIGLLYSSMGQYAQGNSYYEKVLQILETSPDSLNRPFVSSLYECLGRNYDGLGEYAKAHSYLEKSLKLEEEEYLLNHPMFQNKRKVLEELKTKFES